jgi:hypothetical protein
MSSESEALPLEILWGKTMLLIALSSESSVEEVEVPVS